MRTLRFALVILVFAFLSGCASTSSPTSLVDSLSSGLGISADQAAGGVGSVLNYAQTKLEPMDYQKVANTIPGASHYIKKAADLGATTGPITGTLCSRRPPSRSAMGTPIALAWRS